MIKTLIKADQLYFRLISFSLFLMMNIAVFSQSKTIRIINKENGQPISDLFYKYNNTSGISNYRGEITVEFAEGKTLYLSNVQYGKNEIGSSDLKKALQTGILKIAPVAHNLLPVTVIKVHPEFFEKNQFDIPVQEKLEHDAGQLLEQMTSVSVIRKSGAYGFDPVLRGFKYDQLNLVIDGTQTASAACPNRMDPASSQIPINMISTVEVMKGPFSLRYGNAFGGTINFKSSTPQFSEKTKPAGRLGTSYESNGNIFRTEGVAGMSSNKTDLKFFGSLSQGNDYKDGDGLEIPSDFNRLNWGGKFGFKLSDKQNLGLLVTNNRAKNVDFPALPMDLREDNTWMVNASHSAYFYGKALSTWNSTVYFTRVNHLMDNLDKVISPRTVDASTDAKTSNYGGRTEMRFDFKTGYLFSGLDYRMEAAEGERSRNMLMGPMAGKTIYDNVWQEAQIQRGGAFAEYHLKKSDFHAVFSGRIDYNSAKSNNPDPNFAALNPDVSTDFFNPSLSAGGTKMLNDAFSVGLWLGTAQRSPGIAERYINFLPIGLDPYEMVGNPQLKPETNNQADLIFEYKTKSTFINLDLYSSFLRNYISSEIDANVKPKMTTSPGVRRYANIDKALITGFELEWKQIISKFLKHDFTVVYTYGEDKKLKEPLPEIPPLEIKYRLFGNFLNEKILPELLFRQVLKQDRISMSYGETVSPSFNVFDAKISWVASRAITATGGILNLFDTAYYEHLSRSILGSVNPIYSPGRSLFVTLTFNFL
jgi:iron complex outermembrane receptor protein